MKTQQATEFLGVDVASTYLAVAVHGQTIVQRYANTAQGIAQPLRTLPPASVAGLESSGRVPGTACAGGARRRPMWPRA